MLKCYHLAFQKSKSAPNKSWNTVGYNHALIFALKVTKGIDHFNRPVLEQVKILDTLYSYMSYKTFLHFFSLMIN